METKKERFVYRYSTSFIPKYNTLLELQNKYFKDDITLSLKQKDEFCLAIKYAYEYAWKTMKDYLKYKNKPALLPRKIFENMTEFIDTKPWLELVDELYYFFSNRNNENILDNFIENYYAKYDKMFDNFLHFITIEDECSQLDTSKPSELNFITPNHCVLDTYAIVTLVNHFRKYPKIEIVNLHGSRATSNYRLTSDIDFFVKGSYSSQEFDDFKNNLETLKLPYHIDVCDVTNINEKQAEFIERNFPNSIPFYNRYDFE